MKSELIKNNNSSKSSLRGFIFRFLFIGFFICFVASSLFSEIILKEKVLSDGTRYASYFNGNIEVASYKYDKNGKYLSGKGKVPDGVVRKYYSNGKIEEEFYLRNSVRTINKKYWDNGKLKAEWLYNKKGELDGEFKSYNKEAKLQFILVYKEGELKTTRNYSTITGKINYEKLETGSDSYKMTYYYDNGKIKSIRNYINGKLEGEYKEYFSSGELEKTAVYKEAKEISKVTHYKDKQGVFILGVFLFFLSIAVLFTVYLMNKNSSKGGV